MNYDVVRSKRATKPRIDMKLDGMKVVIPEGMNLAPEELIEQKRDWIEKKRKKFKDLRSRIPQRKFEPGEDFPYQGKDRTLTLRETEENRVEDERFVLSKKRVDKNGIKEELETLYRRKARAFIQGIVDEYTVRLGVDYEKLRIKNQKTLWGSCSSKKNLNFNWRIIMAPSDKAEYVVLHELCHLREPNHSPAFWRLLSEHCENPKEKSKWLREHSVELIFTRADL